MRISLFIDGNNFYHTLPQSIELDYDALAKHVVSKVGGTSAVLNGAYYYTGCGEHPNLERFLKALEQRMGFFVRREPVVQKRIQCQHCGEVSSLNIEKRVDTRLVAEMVQYAALNHYDRAVVFSGDQDIVPAVEAVHTLGKQVLVASWGGRALSSVLRSKSYGVIDLEPDQAAFARRRMFKEHSTSGTGQSDHGQERLLELIYQQVNEAFSYFQCRNRHVSRWYFENRWQPPTGDCPPPGSTRELLLDHLIKSGRVEVFEASVNGRSVLALRPKKSRVQKG